MAFEAGSIFVKLGAALDKSGFDQYDRALGGARTNAARGATAKLDADTVKAEAKIARLTAAIKAVDKEKAEAKTDVETAGAIAKLKILQHELDKTSKQTATTKLKSDFKDLGLAAKDLESAFSGGDGKKGLIGTMGTWFGELGMMPKLVAAALPAINGLVGAVGALAGSLGGAGLGVGAVGVAGGAGLAVTLGAIVSVAKPAATEIKNVEKAYAAYNTTLSKFGPKDPATIAAQKELNRVVGVEGGQSVLQLIKQTKAFGDEWKKQTTSARNDMFSILLDGMHTVQHDMGTFAGVTNGIWSNLHDNVDRTFKVMRGTEFRKDISSIGITVDKAMKPVFNAFDHLLLYFLRIARFSGPELVNLAKGFDVWATHLDSASRNTDHLQHNLSDLFGHMHAWMDLIAALGHLLTTVLKGGASSGDNLVTTLTHLLDKWNAFLKTDKGQKDMKNFFTTSVELTKTLFKFLGQGSGAILKIANNLMPAWIAAAKILSATLVPVLVGISKLISEHKSLTDIAAGFIAISVAIGLTKKALGLLLIDMKALQGTRLGGILGGLGGGGGGAPGVGGGGGGIGGLLKRGLGRLGGAGLKAGGYTAEEEALLTAGGRVAGEGSAASGLLTKLPGFLGKDLTGGVGKGLLAGALRASVWGDIGIGITKGIFTGFHKGVSAGAQEALHSITLGLVPGPEDFTKQDKKITDDIDRINELANQAAAARKLGININVDFKHDQVDKGVADILNQLDRTRKGMATSLGGARSDLEMNMKLIQNSMNVHSAAGRDAIAANYRSVASEIQNAMNKGVISTKQGSEEIHRLMLQALAVYGIKGADAEGYLAVSAYRKANPGSTGTGMAHAVGGWIGNPGERGYDDIPMNVGGRPIIVGRGEALLDGPNPAVVNRHQQGPVEIGLAASAAMGLQPYGSLDELFTGINTPHYAAKGGFVGAYATGGRTNEYGGVTGDVAALIHQLDAKGFHHGSTTGGQHAANSFHYRGEAVDFGDANNDMQKLWDLVYPKRNQFAELFGPSYLNPTPTLMHYGSGFSDPGLQQQHNNHIHMALAKALAGAVGMARKVLPNLRVGGPQSALQGLLQTGLDRQRTAAQSRLDGVYNSLSSQANPTTNEPGGGGAPASTYSGPLDRVFPRHNLGEKGVRFTVGQVNQVMRSVGLPLPAFEQIAHGESDYMPGVIGHDPGGTLGYGLLQDTTSVNGPAFEAMVQSLGGWPQMLNPIKNARAAKWLYDRGGLAHWYGTKYLTAAARAKASVGGFLRRFNGGGFTRGADVQTRAGHPLATIARRTRPPKRVSRKPKKSKPVVVKPPRGHVKSEALAAPRRYSTFAGPALKGIDDLQLQADGWEKDYTYWSALYGQTDEQATITLGDADAWFYSGYKKFDATKDPSTFIWQPGDEMANTDGLLSGMYFDDQGNIIGGDKVRGITDHVAELDKLIGIRQNIYDADTSMGKTANDGLGQVDVWGKGARWQLGTWKDDLIKWVKKLRGDRTDVDDVVGEQKTLGAKYQAVVHAIREKYKKRRHQIEISSAQAGFSKAGMTHDLSADVTREEQAALDVIKGGSGSPMLKAQRSAEIRKTYADRRTSLADRARNANFGERMNKTNALWLLTQGESSELYNEQSHNKEVVTKRADMLKGLRTDVSTDVKNRDALKASIRGLLGQMHDTDPGLLSYWSSDADKFAVEDYGSDVKAPAPGDIKNSVKGSFLQKISDLADTLRTEKDITLQPLKDERNQWLAAADKHPRTPGQGALSNLAANAASDLASFQASRASLFSQFGSNFVPSAVAATLFSDPTAQAAGFRYFGATGASAAAGAGIDPAGGSGQPGFVQNNYYQQGPVDPHIHAQTTLMEFQSAFG